MSFFTYMHIQSILMFFLLTTILNLGFVGIIYFANKNSKSILMLLLSNIAQLSGILLIYTGGLSKLFYHLQLSSLLATLQVTFWILSIFLILKIKFNYKFLIILNLACFFQAIFFYRFGQNISLIRANTSLIMAILELYCLALVFFSRRKKYKNESSVIYLTLITISLYHLFRASYRYMHGLNIKSIFEAEFSVAFFITCSFAINIVMNLAIIYLHFKHLMQLIQESSDTDSLTLVHSRKSFFNLFKQKLLDLNRKDDKFALAILDLDDFKRVNDTYGHVIGDEVLKEFAAFISRSLRKNDIIGRYGGEEFVVLIECETAENANLTFQRILSSISNETFSRKDLKITFSCGIVMLDKTQERTVNDWVDLADKKLYIAKAQGKNCIIY